MGAAGVMAARVMAAVQRAHRFHTRQADVARPIRPHHRHALIAVRHRKRRHHMV